MEACGGRLKKTMNIELVKNVFRFSLALSSHTDRNVYIK